MVAERQLKNVERKAKGVRVMNSIVFDFSLLAFSFLVLCGGYLFAAEPLENSKGLAAYRVFPLKRISAEQGKKYLAEAKIGTVSQLPSPNTLLVTAQPTELIKATAILKLVDTEERFVIKAICPASEARNLPSNELIAAEVGDILIGTFSNPPSGVAGAKAIIDIHDDAVIAIVPAGKLERIISAIEQLQNRESSRELPATNHELPDANEAEFQRIAAPAKSLNKSGADVNEFELDELFGNLLRSLADAEKRAAKQARQVSQPNEPGAVVPGALVPEQKAPSKPSAASEQPVIKSELAFQVARQPKEPEPEPEQLVIKPEKPAEVTEPAPAAGSYEPESVSTGEEMLELDLPEKLEISALLRLVGEYLHLNYMYDPARVKGSVTLKLRGPIKVKDLYPLLESVLKFRGFVMTRRGNLVTVVPAGEAPNIDPALLHAGAGKVEIGDVIITKTFKLKYIDTASARNLLTGMKLGVNITPIPETKTLIVTGYAYRMARIEEVLEMVDEPGKPKQFRFRQLKYTTAKTLAPKIKKLAEQLGTISITIGAPAAAAPSARKKGETEAAYRARLARAKRAKPAPRLSPAKKPTVYLDADERTNRILMIGLGEQLVIVDKLIDALDVQQQDLRTLRLYQIQHVGAEEVVKKLGELGIIGAGKAAPARPSKLK